MLRIVVSALALGLIAMHCGTCACDVAVPASGLEQRALLRGLERRIDDGEQARMRRIFPEGGLFTLSFTGFSLVNMAVARPGDEAFRAHARDEVKALLEKTDAERDVSPFSSWGRRERRTLTGPRSGARSTPRASWRGAILEGHQNLLRAGYVLLGGDDVDVVRDFHDTSSALHRRFLRAPSGAIESFWHRTWYVDNAVALESLRLHDVIYGTDLYARPYARFREGLTAHTDARARLPASEVSLDGTRTLDGPRGCALSWLLAFQPDPAMYARYRRIFGKDVLGMRGFREVPPWRTHRADVDSGPIVDGVGAAASAFGVAAARRNGDVDTLARMELPLTILTAPALTLHGDEELFGGQLVLADALSLWARTVTPWDAPVALERARPPFLPALVAFLLAMAPVALAAFALRRSVAPRRSSAGR